jgi:hypothetical protein
MSETLTAYVISVAILAALALFIPCVDSLARLLRTSNRGGEETEAASPKPSASSRKAA